MDKIREEFEEWMLKKIDSLPLHLSLVKYDGGNYINDFTQISWMAWCDSRAALCVELPQDISGEYYADGWNACLMATEAKISEAGVSYK